MSEPEIDPAELPRVAPQAQFVAEHEAIGRSHVVVDGPVLPGTDLCLSHWPATSTPAALRADTSAQIVDKYLDAGPTGPELTLVTNNHYDEDGLFGIWLLLEQPRHGQMRRRAVAAAEAGDFCTWSDPVAAKCALAVMAMAERSTTPFPQIKRALATPDLGDPTEVLYRSILPRVTSLLADPGRYRLLWEPQWTKIEADIDSLEAAESTIDEFPELDLAVVRGPRPLHEMAVYPRTTAMRVLTATHDGLMSLRYRYETWVVYVSRSLAPRPNLAPSLKALSEEEPGLGRWRFEGIDPATPRLYFSDGRGKPAASGLSVGHVIEILRPRLERVA